MTSKVKIELHLRLLDLLTRLTGDNINTVTKSPQQHFVKLMVNKLHQKFYQKLIEKRFNRNSTIIKMTIKFEEAYAFDIFLDNVDIEDHERALLLHFILELNKAIQ